MLYPMSHRVTWVLFLIKTNFWKEEMSQGEPSASCRGFESGCILDYKTAILAVRRPRVLYVEGTQKCHNFDLKRILEIILGVMWSQISFSVADWRLLALIFDECIELFYMCFYSKNNQLPQLQINSSYILEILQHIEMLAPLHNIVTRSLFSLGFFWRGGCSHWFSLVWVMNCLC